MLFLSRISSILRHLLRRSEAEQDLNEEVDSYLDLLTEMKVKEGCTPFEARRAALIDMGGREQIKEEVRRVSPGRRLETLWQDLRYGLRMLRRSPGFSLLAILCLTLGIGSTTAVFSWIEGILLRPFPAVAN